MTETELQVSIISAAERLGWMVYHAERSARKVGDRWVRNQPATGKGFPDLVLLHPQKRLLVFAELKGDVGTRGGQRGTALSEEQTRWIGGLADVLHPGDTALLANRPRMFVTVWRPRDLERIYRLLSTGTY